MCFEFCPPGPLRGLAKMGTTDHVGQSLPRQELTRTCDSHLLASPSPGNDVPLPWNGMATRGLNCVVLRQQRQPLGQNNTGGKRIPQVLGQSYINENLHFSGGHSSHLNER